MSPPRLPADAEPELEETGCAARQNDRQPVLRSVHAHADELRDRCQAAGRGRGVDHGMGSSVSKGESLVDTLNTLGAMRPDAIVMRHAASGAPHFLARHLPTPIINAGDGTHEHPTQALLDARTILDRCGGTGRPQDGHHRRYRAQPRGAQQRTPAF